MCLDVINVNTPEDNTKTGFGWKVFFKTVSNKLIPPIKYKTIEHQFDEKDTKTWVTSGEELNIYDTKYENKYKSGFHVFTDFIHALNFRGNMDPQAYPIVKVEYRNVHAVGVQNGGCVVVAEEIRICV